MDGLANYCFCLFMSQEVSDLRESRSNYYTVLILGGVSLSSWTSAETQIICMTSGGVL